MNRASRGWTWASSHRALTPALLATPCPYNGTTIVLPRQQVMKIARV